MSDLNYFFKYWFTLFVFGIIFYPLTSIIFKKFHDRGWAFSKIIGIAISSWITWILAYLKIFEYTRFFSISVLLLCSIVNWVPFIFKAVKKKKTDANFKFINWNLVKNIAITEFIFILALGFWAHFKGINPDITNSTEKFMDYGYMNSIMKSKYMPPEDIWLSGNSINYYYYGQYVSGFICKVAGLNVNEGYNLTISFIACCTFVLPYCIGFNLLKNLKFKFNTVVKYLLAFSMAFALCFGGTLHYPIYRWFSDTKDSYYYPDETRYIGKNSETEDNTATEVPAYSSIVGDLHAHYIDLIFSLLTISLFLQYFLVDKEDFCKQKVHFPLLLSGFILGLQKMTNFWDLPIYLVVISLVVIIKQIICSKFNLKVFLSIFSHLLMVIVVEELITSPFTLDLYVGTTKVLFTGVTSPLYKLLVLWGFQTFCFIIFAIMFLYKFKQSNSDFRSFLDSHLSDTFIIILGVCAIGLVVLPEIVYLKDIYGDEYKRFNTMFKLTYQAFVLFVICTNYIIFRIILSRNKFIMPLGVVLLIINFCTFGYGFDAINVTTKGKDYIGISKAENYIEQTSPNDFEAIMWIQNNVEKDKVILEASYFGNSYTTSSKVSVFTGNPTVLGWSYHEWIWRCNKDYTIPEIVSVRNDEISSFYTNRNLEFALDFIKKYNVSYIFLGDNEYSTYSNLDTNFILSLGEVAFVSYEDGQNTTYVIKVK